MARSPAPVSPDTVRRLAAEVARHEARDALGALAFDVLGRQAEGRVLFAGRELVDKRAAEHGVTRDRALTAAGNLLDALERGPDGEAERLTIAAFAVHGLSLRLGADAAAAERFVRHADWLEVASPYSVLPFVDAVLSEEQAAQVWSEVAQAIVDEGVGPAGASAASRARNAARLTALAASASSAAAQARRAVLDSSLDAPTLALASALFSEPTRDLRLAGRVTFPRGPRAMRVLRWMTGWALLAWTGRALGAVLGVRREAELTLGARGLELREARFFLGRRVRESVATIATSAIVRAGRDVRYPSLHLLVGTIMLSIGILLGGLVIFDGARSGELTLMLFGAGVALAAAGLDLALDVLVPGTRGRVTVELVLDRGRGLRLSKVPLDDADRFLLALRVGP